MNVSAVIVTRGDVDLEPVLCSLPKAWERVVWDNGEREIRFDLPGRFRGRIWDGSRIDDVSVYGRYAALEHVQTDLVYVQDDDCIVSDPEAIVAAWAPGHVVCNMPQEFRHSGYTDSALVGFGACFERELPAQAFQRFMTYSKEERIIRPDDPSHWEKRLLRTCDVVFTTLTPRILVDVPKKNLPWASAANRMYLQRSHYGERQQMLELARAVRDS